MNRQAEMSADAAHRDPLASGGECTTERIGDMKARTP